MATEFKFKSMNDLFKIFSTKFAKVEGKNPWELSENDVEKFLEFVEKFNKISQTPDMDKTSTNQDEYTEPEVERQTEPVWNPDEAVKAIKTKYSAYAPGVWVKHVDNTSEDNPSSYRKYGYIRSIGYTIDYKAKVVNPYIVLTWLEDTAIDSATYANKTYLLTEDKFKIVPSITSINFIKRLLGKVLTYDPKRIEYANSAELITRVSKHNYKELLILNGWYIPSLIWDRRGKLLNTTIDGKPILQALFEEA
jgi:hypothetical protein